ncbi:MAG: histidine phosphatase family protein [Desulfobacterales bacterium]|nr:MAG: histidine phosphatase family protein [Desulfobacterales bacterium]
MIYLIRHGVIEGAEERRFIGQSNPPLSEAGRHNAGQWNKLLAGIEFEAVFCSDLRRAQETARIIAGDKQPAVQPVPQLREIHLGQWEGLSMNYIRRQFPEKWRRRGENISSYKPPEGESFNDLQSRVVPFFEALGRQLRGHALIVAHAGVNRVILCHVLGMPVSDLFRLRQDYGALNIIDYAGNNSRVIGLNLMPDDFGNGENKSNAHCASETV